MLQKILSIAKWIAGVIGGITAIAGIVAFIYAQGQRAEQKRYSETSITIKVDQTLKNDSVFKIQLNEILANQSSFLVEQNKLITRFDRLNSSYVNLLKTDKKIDILINYLETEKKNKEVTLWQTPLKPQE